MLRPLALLFASVFLPSMVLAAPSVEVRDVRVWAGPDGTRVVLELSGRAEHTLFSLTGPDRIVVDVESATLHASAPAGQGVIKQVRFGDRDGSLRVVFDLNERVQVRSSLLPPAGDYGYRLVLDLGSAMAREPTPVKVAHPPQEGSRDLVIAVDAGHGGEDPGAIGRSGTREKDVALAIARALARQIDKEEGMRAVLIRDGDFFVSLRDRRNLARKRNADLFVSVHADSIRDRAISGSSVYILSTGRASSEAARWLAERENAADLIGGVSLDDKDNMLASVLLDLSQTATLTASMTAAEQVLGQLDRIGEVRKPQIQQASLAVLTSPDVPSMLVETAYISNPADEKKLRDARYQERLASAIHAGIREYFFDNPPPGTRFAQLRAAKRVADSSGGE